MILFLLALDLAIFLHVLVISAAVLSISVLHQKVIEGSTLEIFDQKLHFALGVLFCPTYLLPIVPYRSAAGKLYVVSGTSPR